MALSSACAVGAAVQAVADSGWKPQDDEARERTGVMIGSGIGGLPGIAEMALTLHERGPRRVSPFFIPASLINLASGNVSIPYGFKGPNPPRLPPRPTRPPPPPPPPPPLP